MWVLAFDSLGYIPSREITGSCDNCLFNFWSNIQTVFQSSCTILQSYQECKKVPNSPYPQQHVLSSAWLIIAPSIFSKLLKPKISKNSQSITGKLQKLPPYFLPQENGWEESPIPLFETANPTIPSPTLFLFLFLISFFSPVLTTIWHTVSH